jgi:hypothetical protein
MALAESDMADFASAIVRKLAAYEKELDAIPPLVRELLHTCGYLQGYERGRKDGRATGRRAAKGLKTPAKKRGRPAETDEVRELLFKDVEERPPGQTIEKVVEARLTTWRLAQRYFASEKTRDDKLRLADPRPPPPDHLWREAEAMAEAETGKYCNAYYRWRRHPPAVYQPAGGSTADKSATAPVGKRKRLDGRMRKLPVRAMPGA